MSGRMFRRSDVITATIANGAALSDAFDFSFYSTMIVTFPAEWTAADVGFHVSTTSGGTFTPLYDAAAALLEIDGPAISASFAAPAGVAGSRFVKLWSESAASGVNQLAERTLIVTVKA